MNDDNDLFPIPAQPEIVLTAAERWTLVHLIRFYLYQEEIDHINGTRLRDIYTALNKLERKDHGDVNIQ